MNIVISILIAFVIGIIGYVLGRYQEKKHNRLIQFMNVLEEVFDNIPDETKIKEQPINPNRLKK